MSDDNRLEQLTPQLQALATTIRELASQSQGSSLELLALLRLLEGLHQEIRDGVFQAALPDNRRALYSLLKDIEAEGGWPYIHRLKLQRLLQNFSIEAEGTLLTDLLSESGSSPSHPEISD